VESWCPGAFLAASSQLALTTAPRNPLGLHLRPREENIGR
jgi:hypothetical protein